MFKRLIHFNGLWNVESRKWKKTWTFDDTFRTFQEWSVRFPSQASPSPLYWTPIICPICPWGTSSDASFHCTSVLVCHSKALVQQIFSCGCVLACTILTDFHFGCLSHLSCPWVRPVDSQRCAIISLKREFFQFFRLHLPHSWCKTCSPWHQ